MAKSKTRKAAPVKSQKGIEVRYRRVLNKYAKLMIEAVNEEVLTFIKAHESSYVTDQQYLQDNALASLTRIRNAFDESEYASIEDYEGVTSIIHLTSRVDLHDSTFAEDGIGDQLGIIFNKISERFTGTAAFTFAKSAASQMVEKVSKTNKKKFDKSVERATGVDIGTVITSEGLEDFMSLSVNKNVRLIKSLPEEYIKQVETIVNNGVASGARYSTIKKEIVSKTGANHKLIGRIKTIAMNEIQTINAQITLRRSENLGIKEGIFRTSGDEVVRACHKELNGVQFEIAKGAWSPTCKKFIQPGITDINCR